MFTVKRFSMSLLGLVLCLVVGTQVQADLILSDNFDAAGALNDNLGTRQSGSAAPLAYTSYAGNPISYTTVCTGGELAIAGSGTAYSSTPITVYSGYDPTKLVGEQYSVARRSM